MTFNGWLQIAIYCVLIFLFVKPFGAYMANVFDGRRTALSLVLRPVERGIYAVCGVNESEEQHWVGYATSVLLFSIAGFVVLYALQRLQSVLPFNPADMSAVEQSSSFNTAVSFMTNTNWQGYGGETTMSYLTQMAGLTTQNFVSSAAGIAIAIALVRGFARRSAQTIGNFWVDLTRCVVYLLLPMAVVVALVLIVCGVPQNLGAYTDATTLEGAKQIIAQGPVASQVAIKQLGTNGGGFFNANSSHPLENPNALSNLLEMWSILSISAALTYTFGRMVGNQRQGWAIFAVMGILFLAGMVPCYWANPGNPAFAQFNVDQTPSALQSGGNMEGKEVRYGITNSTIWATTTTDASNGSVNSMHDSYMPIGGMVPMVNIMVGEIIFGGVGSGLYGILLFVVLGMFIAGLMVGRTPEYLGKKLESKEVKMAILAILAVPASILGWTALATVVSAGCGSRQRRTARFQRDPICVHVRHGEQRQRLCRPEREHALLEYHHRSRDADRSLHDHRPGACGGRIAGPQEDRAGLLWHVPDRYPAVRRPYLRRDRDRRRARLLPRAFTRTHRRELRDACRHPL